MEARQPTPLDDFLFDLRGYLVLKNAVEPELVDRLNAAIDAIPPLEYGEWLGTHMIGYNVTEMIAETVTARKLETTYHEVLNAIHPHPTISESVKDAIEVAYGEAIHI